MLTFNGKRIKDDYTNNVFIITGLVSFNAFCLAIFQILIFPYLSKIMYIPDFMFIGYVVQCIYLNIIIIK